MTIYLISALLLLQIASMQYMSSIHSPATMPVRSTWNIFHAFGLVSGATFWVLFFAGFIFSEWWVPFVGLFGGMALSELIPHRMRQPGVVYLSTLLASPLVVIAVAGM